MKCPCGNWASLLITMGCAEEHITEIAYCAEHRTPVEIPQCRVCYSPCIEAYLYNPASGGASMHSLTQPGT